MIDIKKKCMNCMRDFPEETTVCPYCGFRRGAGQRDPFYLMPGTIIAQRYLVGTAVGSGGFSIIYRGWDLVLNRLVGIKEFFQKRLMTRVPGTSEAVIFQRTQQEFRLFIQSFIDEARTVSRFVEHPNIVDVYDYFESNQTAYMVMELLDGISLQQLLKQHQGILSEQMMIPIAVSLLEALETIHREQYLHRDLSPKNVFLCRVNGKTVVKLIDFGAACFYGKAGTGIYPAILTPCYAPPEQYDEKGNQGPWTDLYALGAMIYRCMTGQLPPESVLREKDDQMLPPKELRPDLSDHLNSVILRALSLDISVRFQTDEQFREALTQKLVVKTGQEMIRHRKKRRLLISIGSTVLAAAIVTGGIFLFRAQKEEGTVQDTAISIWVRVKDQETVDQARQRFEAMSESFTSLFPNVTMNVRYLESERYDSELQDALENGKELPTLFGSEGVDKKYHNRLSDLNQVIADLKGNGEYFGIDSYHQCFPDGKQIPLSFQLPVMYVYGEKTDDSLLTSAKQVVGAHSGEYLLYYDQAVNYLNNYCDPVVLTEPDAVGEVSPAQFEGVSFCQDVKDFCDGKVTYLLADTSLYPEIESSTRGKLQIAPQDGDTLYAYFDDLYSISSSATAAEKKAAAALLKALLSENAQSVMNFGNDNGFHALPLHRQAFQTNQDLFNLPDLTQEADHVRLIGDGASSVREDCLGFCGSSASSGSSSAETSGSSS